MPSRRLAEHPKHRFYAMLLCAAGGLGCLVVLLTCNGFMEGSRDPPPPEDTCTIPDFNPPANSVSQPRTLYDRARFLFEYLPGQHGELDTRIQTIPHPESVPDSDHIAVLTGTVRGRDDKWDGLPCVKVTVLGHEEYGATVSRKDGRFDLAVDGDRPLTLVFEKPGYLTAHRDITPHKLDFSRLDDVRLVRRSTDATRVDFAALTDTLAVRGHLEWDRRDKRRVTMLFRPGTHAFLRVPVLKDGKPTGETIRKEVPALNISAVEYTVGEHGPEAMPAPLLDLARYTYAFNVSADEAVSGAESIEFEGQKVYIYVENFLGFPAGTLVPSGYYDRQLGRWSALDNGRVIRILDIVDGKARLDVFGQGRPASPQTLKLLDIDEAELRLLGREYAVGQELWRVPHEHFTDIDYNWPLAPPLDARYPDPGQVKTGEEMSAGTCTRDSDGQSSSEETKPFADGAIRINCKQRNFVYVASLGTRETADIVYNEKRVPDYYAGASLLIPLRSTTGDPPPPSLKRVDLRITTAGQYHEKSWEAAEFLTLPNPFGTSDFWNGLNSFGQPDRGKAHIELRWCYQGEYVYDSDGNLNIQAARKRIFNTWPDQATFEVVQKDRYSPPEEFCLWRPWDKEVERNPGLRLRLDGLGAAQHPWLLRDQGLLEWDDGYTEAVYTSLPYTIEQVAGQEDHPGHGDGGGTATAAQFNHPGAIFSNGNGLYISDTANCQFYLKNGTNLARYIGKPDGTCGQPIAETNLDVPPGTFGINAVAGVATTPNQLFMAIPDKSYSVFLVNQFHQFYRVVGTGTGSLDWTQSKSPTDIGLQGPAALATMESTDNSKSWLVIGDKTRLLALALPVNPAQHSPTDWMLAAGDKVQIEGIAFSEAPEGLAVDAVHGRLYVSDTGQHCIRALDLQNPAAGDWTVVKTATIGACGTAGFRDGAPAKMLFNRPAGLAFDANKNQLYVADSKNQVVRRIDLDQQDSNTVAGQPAVDSQGNPHICQERKPRVFAGDACLGEPLGLALNGTDLYVSDGGRHVVYRVAPVTRIDGQMKGLGDVDVVPSAHNKDGQLRYLTFKPRNTTGNDHDQGEPIHALTKNMELLHSYTHKTVNQVPKLSRIVDKDGMTILFEVSYGGDGLVQKFSAEGTVVDVDHGKITARDGASYDVITSLRYHDGSKAWKFFYEVNRGGLVRQIEYSAAGMPTKVYTFEYDSSGRLARFQDPEQGSFTLH